MATLRERLHRKNASGAYDIVHFETDSKSVIMEDGTNLQNYVGGLKYVPLATSSTAGSFDKTTTNPTASTRLNYNGYFYATKITGAVYNDYAEYRRSDKAYEPGCVLTENSDGVLSICRKANCPCCVVTDTYGFIIGNTDDSVPVATSGRVLVYYNGNIKNLKIGTVVTSSKNGKVKKMSKLAQILHPAGILGIVSEIPEYSVWGTDNVPVNGRIWIRLK